MKSSYRKTTPSRLVALLLIIIAGVIIHSCKKDRAEQKIVSDAKLGTDLSNAKKWYDSVYKPTANSTKLSTQSTGKTTHDLSKKFIPNWAKATTFTRNGITYIEIIPTKIGDMAMSFTKPKDTLNYDFSKSGTFSDLILVKTQTGYSMYVMSILADSSYLRGDYSKVSRNSYQKMDADFTGAVFFKNMDGSFLNGYRYEKGQITRTLTPYAGGSGQIIQSIGDSKQQINESAPCGAIIGVTVYEDCYTYPSGTSLCYISSVVDVTEDCGAPSGGTGGSPGGNPGGGNSSSPCTPPQGNSSVSSSGLTINVAMPPPGGGTTPPPCPVTTVTTTVNPCAQVAQVTTLAQYPAILQSNHYIFNDINTGHEWGNEDNLATWPANGSYISTPVVSNYADGSFTATFTWDSSHGYTINISHDHPGGNAPSPGDVAQLVNNSVNPLLKAAGATALDYYKKHASITVVSANATYVVTIADFNALSSIVTEQTLQSLNTQYQNAITASNGSSEYALLSIFGPSINVYRASANGTDFVPLNISKGVVVPVNCP